MIRHIVLLRFVENADEEAIDRYATALSALPSLIPEVIDFSYGRNAGGVGASAGSPNWDFVVSSTFANLADYRVYAEHPDHRALVETHLVDLMADRAAIQIEEAEGAGWVLRGA